MSHSATGTASNVPLSQMQTKTWCVIHPISMKLLLNTSSLPSCALVKQLCFPSPQTPRTQIYLLMPILLNTDELDTCSVPSLSPLCIWHLPREACTSAVKSLEKLMTYDLLSEMIQVALKWGFHIKKRRRRRNCKVILTHINASLFPVLSEVKLRCCVYVCM